MGQPWEGGLRARVAAGFSDGGRRNGGNAWDIHQVWVGGVWGQVGEVSKADEVWPVGYPKCVGCEAVGHRDGFGVWSADQWPTNDATS